MISFKKALTGLFIACLLAMTWSYFNGYNSSIDWEVTTLGEVIEYPAWTLETDLTTHVITGEKYLLSENYSGSEIKRNMTTDQVLMGIMWLGLCLFMTSATYLKRYAFFASVGLFALFLNRLNLFEIGLFGIDGKAVIFIPFLVLITPLVIFHEYWKRPSFLIRLVVLVGLSALLLLGVDKIDLFTDHLIAHSLYGFTICGLLFLFIIAEELIFSVLYVVTSGKGGTSNHLHFVLISLLYIGNLTFYYLNKSGIFDNDIFFFDPFILLVISSIIALWSIQFKAGFLSKHLDKNVFYTITFSLGVIALSFLTHQFIRGNDGVFEAFHYFILYFHLGFATFFFLYIIGNFIDPLIKGFQVYKIAYKERNFPYASARLGGFFAVLAFYFLANQEPFNLLKAGYYNYLAQEAQTDGNVLLAREYTLQSSFIGYNTHMANYNLGWYEQLKGNEFAAKSYFQSASSRFPSTYAWVNYGNLDVAINPNKVQAIYEEALRNGASGEMENNLGMLHLEKENYEQSLDYFENAIPSQSWNNAPILNKWNVLNKLRQIDSVSLVENYHNGNYGVRSNILALTEHPDFVFDFSNLRTAGHLHRQAYLLNSLPRFSHDSLAKLTQMEVENSTDRTVNNRLRKALALHYYQKGEVNEAFLVLDYLQTHAHQYYQGTYLDIMGKLAMDQQAYTSALEFFDRAIDLKYANAIFGKIEALARMGRKEQVPDFLLRELRKYPELTDQANQLLDRLESYSLPGQRQRNIPDLASFTDQELIDLGRKNAFHEAQVIAVVDELEKREVPGGYELLIDATEINPYSAELLMKYAFFALNWNLIDYAEQTVEELQELLTDEAFAEFSAEYEKQKAAIETDEW